jgi:hypothetical protein
MKEKITGDKIKNNLFAGIKLCSFDINLGQYPWPNSMI